MTDTTSQPVNRPKLSIVIMARDEELNIVDCVKSADFADEVIVVDTGSADDTRQLAAENRAIVKELAWHGFGLTKSKALEMGTGDWVLSLDADERIPPALAEEILTEIRSSKHDGFELPRRSFFLGHEMRHGGWDRDWVLRLMRHGQFKVTGDAVHEKIIVKGSFKRLYHPLDHHTNPTFAAYQAKIELYSTLAAIKIAKDKSRHAGVWAGVRHGLAAIIKKYLLQQGYRDGALGALLAVSTGYEKFLRYTKAGLIRKGMVDELTRTRLNVVALEDSDKNSP
ncbi:MAG TPA: glycosyltransferase family 2 protein [Bacteroidetes bacterium]|nr:glycosyl transferase family 2 [bacterium BMS3Bbin04]HDO66267.1 glycosyltransferase family 2 protein [Bacteroidota bacterium]HEX05392.1 glycosyltransferase family 2 protein [Bacteroidota bacterium]